MTIQNSNILLAFSIEGRCGRQDKDMEKWEAVLEKLTEDFNYINILITGTGN